MSLAARAVSVGARRAAASDESCAACLEWVGGRGTERKGVRVRGRARVLGSLLRH